MSEPADQVARRKVALSQSAEKNFSELTTKVQTASEQLAL